MLPARRCSQRIARNPIVASPERPTRSKSKYEPKSPKFRNKEVVILSESEDEGYDTYKPLSTPKKNKAKVPIDTPESPPKQRKILESPSQFIQKLSVGSPKGNKVRKKNLFQPEDCVENKKNTESCVRTAYLNARKALHCSKPNEMPGREQELENLRKFIREHLDEKCSGSLYISGPPGTGKTASLMTILEDDEIVKKFNQVYVNCTSLKSPTAVFSRIVNDLGIKSEGKSEKEYIVAIEAHMKKSRKMILLILDEIDQLEYKNQSVLYKIFEWPSTFSSQLLLIGIANALDLTDRILPRLQARCELKPELMHFSPYTREQIEGILSSRLKGGEAAEVFSPAAVRVLAAKVAAVSGDARRALDIGRRVVEMVERSSEDEGTLKSIENVNHLVEKQMRSVEIKEVADVINNIYNTAQTLTDEQHDSALPLQQKLILCSLVLLLRKSTNKDITLGRLYETYRKVCQKQHITALEATEFYGSCSLIEARGMVKVVGKKELRQRKVNLEWDEEEVFGAMMDKQLVSQVLQDSKGIEIK